MSMILVVSPSQCVTCPTDLPDNLVQLLWACFGVTAWWSFGWLGWVWWLGLLVLGACHSPIPSNQIQHFRR